MKRREATARECISGALGLCATVVLALWATSADAFIEQTHLLDLRAGTPLSKSVNAYQSRGYELSDGTFLVFGDWYRANWPDVHVQFLTTLRPNFAVIWGFGTGEKGGQYEIQPSLHLGVLVEKDLSRSETLSLSVHGTFGGNLSERPCIADYGAVGGTQVVNCRLAATTMRPVDTLNYLFDESPTDRLRIRLRYEFRF